MNLRKRLGKRNITVDWHREDRFQRKSGCLRWVLKDKLETKEKVEQPVSWDWVDTALSIGCSALPVISATDSCPGQV